MTDTPQPPLVPSAPMPEPEPPFYELWTTDTPAPTFISQTEDGQPFVPHAGVYYHALSRAEYESHLSNGWATPAPPQFDPVDFADAPRPPSQA